MHPLRFLHPMREPHRQDQTPSLATPHLPGQAALPIPTVIPQTRQDLMAVALRYLNAVRANAAPVPMDIDPPFDAAVLGLKEIGNLASWTVSSCKPGCGVEALRDEDTGLFWQYVYEASSEDASR